MKIDEIREYATQLATNDQNRDTMYQELEQAYLCIDDSLPDAEWIKPTISPDARNAVEGAKRLLTAADPIFSVPVESNPAEIGRQSSMLERAANALWINAGLAAGRPRHYDPVLSALMYSEVQIPIISTKRLAETMKGKAKERWTKIAQRAPVLFDCVNPREGHSSWGLGGLEAYYSKRLQTVGQVRARFGEDILASKSVSATATLNEFWSLDQHAIWVEGEDKPLLDEDNPWPFIPVVSVMVEGSMLFSVDSTYQTRQPFLYTVWKTGIWKRQNLFLTLMSSLAFEVGANPLLVFTSVGEDNPVIDYTTPGGMIKIKQGESLQPLLQKVISNDLLEQSAKMDDLAVQSTLYRQVLGEPVGSNAPYSLTALLSQAGRLPLVVYQRLASFAVTQAIQMAFQMVREDGGAVRASSKTGLEELKASDIPEDFHIEATLDVSMPQDDRMNAQVAVELTNPQHPMVSDRYAREKILRIGQPDEMTQEIEQERYEAMYAERDRQAEMQKLMAQGQPEQPGQPGPEQGGPGFDPRQMPPPPEMGDAGLRGVRPGLPMGEPMEPMGAMGGPGGLPPEGEEML